METIVQYFTTLGPPAFDYGVVVTRKPFVVLLAIWIPPDACAVFVAMVRRALGYLFKKSRHPVCVPFHPNRRRAVVVGAY